MTTQNNFTIDTTNMSAKQIANVGRLLIKAEKLGWFDHGHYGPVIQVGYNNTYGNTYIWSEDHQYSIFITDFDSTIKALYSCPYDGEETERNCSNDADAMNKWEERLQRKSEKKENS